MELYNKPVVLLNEELSEGVYAASGADDNTTQMPDTPDTEPKLEQVCDSIYMKGNYVQPDFSDWANGTNINGRGCEGCPACWSDGSCHVASYPAEEDCRPSWEVQGKSPNALWNQ